MLHRNRVSLQLTKPTTIPGRERLSASRQKSRQNFFVSKMRSSTSFFADDGQVEVDPNGRVTRERGESEKGKWMPG